jgi:23S rRNA (guanosine2251-2'-O)-methyltransferase
MRLVTGLQPVREAIRVHGKGLERVLVEKGAGPQIEAVARFATDRGARDAS